MARWIVALLAAALVLAAPARADTIAFERDGDVWLVQPDGSGLHQVTHGEHEYAWPSESDAGTLVAVDADGWIHRMTQTGAALGAPLATAATQATQDTPAEPPTHVRISPDGQRIAYDEVIADDATTLWTPAGATGLDFPNQSAGQEGLEAPSWIGSDRLLLSRDIASLGSGDEFALYHAGDGDDSAQDWFDSDQDAWASDLEAASARSGKRLVVLADDSADYGGFPQRAELRLYGVDVPGGRAQAACTIALPAEETVGQTSPAFSPDGTRLAWAESDGIHVAVLGAMGRCDFKEDVIAAPGAWEPYWSPADDAAAPAAGGHGGAGGAPGRLKLRVAVAAAPRRATLLRRGLGARITCSAACNLRIVLRLDAASAKRAGIGRVVAAATRKLAAAGTVKLHLKLHPAAVRALRALTGYRLTLRVSAPGATRISRVLRPR